MKFHFGQGRARTPHGSPGGRVGKTKTATASIGGGGGGIGPGGGGGGGGSGGSGFGGGGNYDISRFNPVHDNLEIGSVIEDWMPRDQTGLNQMWRLIYLRDAIVGPAVDLYSNLPYSECRLTGIDDPAIMRVYQDTMERLDIVTMMPELVREFLMIGRFCSSLIFDRRQGVFTDWTTHDPDFLRIEPIPVRGFDPKIDLVASPALKNFLHSMDPRDMAVRDNLPPEFFDEFEKTGTYKLNPLNTLFVPRRANPYDYVGCVTGDTLLSTDKGFIRIEDVPKVYSSQGDGTLEAVSVQVPSITGYDTATHWVDKGEQPTKKIVTEHGYSLVGTLDHPVLVLDPSSLEHKWSKLSEVSDGAVIALNKKPIWSEDDAVLDYTHVQSATNNAKVHTTPPVMTKELALVLGYLTAEGYVRNDKVSFSNANTEVLEDFLGAFRSCFPTYEPCIGKPRENGLKEITIASVYITRFLHSIGLDPVRAAAKEIPWSIMQSTESCMVAYLSGLFEGDGTTRASECGLTSKSEELIKQVQVVLLNCGILSSISQAGCEMWFLRMSGTQYDLFHKAVGFRSSNKRHDSFRADNRRSRGFNSIPGLKSHIENFVKSRRLSVGVYSDDTGNEVSAAVTTQIYGWFGTRANVHKGLNWLSRISPAKAEQIRELADLTVHWEIVSSAEDCGKQHVYDLVVPESHAFTSNGIISHNTSFLTRIVSFWALEKSLIESTVTNARRRTRSILHVTAGLDNMWEPTEDELAAISGLFIQADEDPVGAVVTTRTGVETNEVKSGADFWKLSDEWSFLTEGKMRALGISDAFLSGDATYNNMETALSVFMESLRTLRNYMDRRVFYEKVFATIARVHGFIKPDARSRHQRGPRIGQTLEYKNAIKIPREDLLMPKIVWDKKLQPEGDMNFLEMLQSADEAGVPVTLKQWASGAGLNLEEMMEELEEDGRYRKMTAEWRKQFTGDQAMEQEVMSSLGLRAIPVWDAQHNFLILSSNEAMDVIEHFTESRRNLSKLESPGETMRTISTLLDGNAMKTELMGYLLRRLGIATSLPMEDSTYEAISEHLFKVGTATDSGKKKKAVHAEFETLAKMMTPQFSENEKKNILSKANKDVSPFSSSSVTGI